MSQIQTTTKAALSKGREIAAGGEGKIFEHTFHKDHVIKLYHQPRKADFTKHLIKLSKLQLTNLNTKFVTPDEVYVDTKGNCLGFSMNYVNFNDYWLFNNLFNKGFCNNNGVDKAFKIRVLEQLAECIEFLHKEKITVGDLNQYNLFVSKKGDVLFVDVDSYATKDSPHNGVLLDDIRDWTTLDINEDTDVWAYDILAFWATTFCHPFKWVAPGNKETLEQRVKDHKSILMSSRIPGIKIPALYEPPQGEVEKQFNDVFNGRRYIVNFKGVHVPVSAVVKQPMSSQTLIIRELYDHVTHVYACDTSITFRTNDLTSKWTLLEASIQKQVRPLFEISKWEEIYPTGNRACYRIGNDLFMSDGSIVKRFIKPTWDYNNECLTVIDYATDMQWNFNLRNQMGGLDSTSTPVFAKSVIKRTGNIQNFGSQKFLNIPMGNRYSLIPVLDGIQDAFKVKNYMAQEVKLKSKVKFYITQVNNLKTPPIELDYLPKFAVTLDNKIVLVPENGYIDLYSNGQQMGAKFDCPLSTRDSALYCTQAGIFMLENNILYLLNTK